MSEDPRLSMLALPYTPAVNISCATPTPPTGGSVAAATVTPSTPPAAPWVGARLVIDIGADTTTALAEIDGRRIPLTFDGQLELPTPRVDVLGRRVDIKAALRPGADAARHTAEQAAYGALLLRLAESAGTPISQLVLTVPPTWGPRRRDLVRQCAIDAGLPSPVIISEAAAAAQATMPHAAEGATVLVCDLGTRGHVTVLARTGRGWHQLATRDSDVYGGHGLDRAMAEALAPDHRHDPALLARCASARLDLHAQATFDDGGAAAIRIPGQDLATIYHFDDLIEVADEACQQVVAAARETLSAAGTQPGTLSAVVVRGGASRTIDPAGDLRAALSATPVEPDDPHLLCHGALGLAPLPSPTVTMTVGRRRRSQRWLQPGHLAAIVLPAILGAHLATQEIDETFTYTDRLRSYRDMYDYQKIQVLFDRPAFANAAWCLMLSAIATGTLLAAILHRHDHDEGTPGAHARLAGRIQLYAVMTGLAIVLMQGLLGYAVIGSPPLDVPRFPLIAFAGAAVPATVTVLVGLLAPLSARLRSRGWADRLYHPVTGPLLAVAASIAGNLYFDTPRLLEWIPLPAGGGQRIAAVLAGIAIAVTLVTHRVARTILAIVLALGALLATSDYYTFFAAGDQLTTVYLVIVGLWWIRQGASIALDAHPNGLRRMWDAITQPVDPPTPAQAATGDSPTALAADGPAAPAPPAAATPGESPAGQPG